MNTVQALWESGLWLDLAVAITALELLVLGCLHAFTRRGLPLHAWALNLVAGLLLMLALRLLPARRGEIQGGATAAESEACWFMALEPQGSYGVEARGADRR